LCDIASSLNPASAGLYGWDCINSVPLSSVCFWEGVQCDQSSTKVQAIILPIYSLYGTISTSIGSLSDLNYLNLNGNGLTGTLPTQLGFLTKMKYLDIGATVNFEQQIFHLNNIAGTLPSEIAFLSLLRVLDLSGNQLTNTIGTFIGKLLFTFKNKFSSHILF